MSDPNPTRDPSADVRVVLCACPPEHAERIARLEARQPGAAEAVTA